MRVVPNAHVFFDRSEPGVQSRVDAWFREILCCGSARPRQMTQVECGAILTVRALPEIPIVWPGDDLAAIASEALARARLGLLDGDILVVASKVISRAEGRFVDLASVTPSPRAERLATRTGKDARLVELVLRESLAVSRAAPAVLIVRHRLGFISAEAGIDFSNAAPPSDRRGQGPWALLLPVDPDASAAFLRSALERHSGRKLAVVVSDSHGRPFRLGTVGVAIGVSGLPPLWDRRGERDLFGRTLEHTLCALADQVATAADLVAGQAAEGRPFVHIRGLSFSASDAPGSALCRPLEQDLYAGSPGEEPF